MLVPLSQLFKIIHTTRIRHLGTWESVGTGARLTHGQVAASTRAVRGVPNSPVSCWWNLIINVLRLNKKERYSESKQNNHDTQFLLHWRAQVQNFIVLPVTSILTLSSLYILSLETRFYPYRYSNGHSFLIVSIMLSRVQYVLELMYCVWYVKQRSILEFLVFLWV